MSKKVSKRPNDETQSAQLIPTDGDQVQPYRKTGGWTGEHVFSVTDTKSYDLNGGIMRLQHISEFLGKGSESMEKLACLSVRGDSNCTGNYI